MSDISIFTAVKYNNDLENPPVTGWCAQQLDNWTFPLFGSEIEVIEFNKDSDLQVARYQENTPESNALAVAFRIVLFLTVIFPLIVLIARAVMRHNIEFKKIEPTPLPSPPPSPPHTSPKIDPATIHLHLLEEDAGKEIRVPVGKAFSISLFRTPSSGHQRWEISQMPSFIHPLAKYIKDREYTSDFGNGRYLVGNGDDYVFVFEPKESGRGTIVMKLPCSFDATRTVKQMFTMIAE